MLQVSILAVGEASLRPLRLGPLLLLAIHLEVHPLVEEGQKPLYLSGLRDRLRVVPDEVLDPIRSGLNRPVRGDPLVRAPSGLLALDEYILAHVLGRDIVARRQPRLEQDLRSLRLGDYLPVHPDLDV